MDSHARYEDEHWEGSDLAGTEAEAVELLDMRLEKVELTGSVMPRWSVKGTRFSECSLANLEAPRSEWIAAELHGCRLTGMDLRDSTGRHLLFADCRADLISLWQAPVWPTTASARAARWSRSPRHPPRRSYAP